MADNVLADVRTDLKDGLTLPVIKQLLDDLRKERVLNEEEAETILDSNAARADKARDLIDSVRKKGRVASEIMIVKLKVHDEHLYNKLELGKHVRSACGKPAPEAPAHQSLTVSDKGSDKEYPMTSNPRGFCVIINNMNFKKTELNRKGSNYDAAALEKVFKLLGFNVQPYTDLKAKEMKELLLEFSKKEGHGDCFVCCVLSHGEKNGVNGTDMKLCPMKDILSPFDGKNCPSLAGKPKVFFIQACRGKNREEKVVVSADDVPEGDDSDLTPDAPEETYSIPKNSDFLVAMSTVEDFVSYRTPNGSWFIDSLCTQLEEGSQSGDDILTILTKVNEEVSRKEGLEKVNQTTCDAKMTPEPRFTLTKKLIFRIP
ncbi:caspase-22 [Colossoma macropomum]|uniref:caspase-22 n=1 Tax=Colossoma macropomum TaxID=42526 RepID=UPI001864F694|nr:caspase-22 [Colossoma macropomum]